MTVRCLVAAAALGTLTVTPASGQDAPEVGELRLAACDSARIQGPARCGTFTVWENRDARSGRTIDLNVVVLEATADEPGSPVVFLAGGPGQGATSMAPSLSGSPIRENRDVLLVDQRGTGESNGLYCGPSRTAPLQAFVPTIDPERAHACRDRLEERADLRRYLTPYAMDDLDDLRAALGYERLNLYGASYGTRAALVYLRRHGQHVRTAVLWGSTAMSRPMPGGFAPAAEAALDAVIEDCADEPACSEAFPELREDYRRAVEAIEDDGPLTVTVADPRDGDSVDVSFRARDFAESLRAMLYGAGSARRIPLFLHLAATDGTYRPFAAFQLRRNLRLAQGVADGMYFAVTCTEDVARSDTAEVYAAGRGTFLSDHRARAHVESCRGWPRGRLPDGYGEEVASDVPVLIVTGEHDPATPPAAARTAARRLTNARVVIVPFAGHAVVGPVGAASCVNEQIVGPFLDAADVDAPDTACLDELRRPPFVLSLDA